MSTLPLPVLYSETLTSLLPVFEDSSSLSSASTQTTITSSLDNLYLIQRMLNSLALFSGNEVASELGASELLFMSVGWVVGACEERGGLGGSHDRSEAINRAEKNAYTAFIELLDTYKVVASHLAPNENATAVDDSSSPAHKREVKIRQYKYERGLRERIASFLNNQVEPSSNPLTFILSQLRTSSDAASIQASQEEVKEHSRNVILEILRLLYALASSSLISIRQELLLLSSAPSLLHPVPSTSDREGDGPTDDDKSWRLDRPPPMLTKRTSLISGGGKVLRPFTILPSTTHVSARERLGNQVFSQSWRLPTMTIDEYLAEEQVRGNIISGGGQASYDAPTPSELLALAAEEDGTLLGDDSAEQLRIKNEEWARFTELNRKGAGNTMNKG